MKEIIVKDADLRKAAENDDMDVFVALFVNAIREAIGGELSAENMSELNSDQITLLAWDILHSEVMDGGAVQLIHNGYGAFIWMNPTDKAFRNWSQTPGCDELFELYKWINKSHKFYNLNHDKIEADCDDDDFMALFEQYPEFDDFDDEFVEKEEQWTMAVAQYIDENIDSFARIE